MPEIFLISDTHFGHNKILEFEPTRRELGATIEEHNEALVDRWNSVVRPKDTVWHLGDVLFGREAFKYLARLNGIKKLVMGNHDNYPVDLYLRHFRTVKACVKLDNDFLLTHIPVHESQKHRFTANIHGHLHSRTVPGDPFYVNVSCERIDFTPIPLHVVKRGLTPEVTCASKRNSVTTTRT